MLISGIRQLGDFFALSIENMEIYFRVNHYF